LRRSGEDLPVEVPEPSQLLELIRALPAGRPLSERLGEAEGVFLVGGAVRDLLLGGHPFDLDLVVEGDAAALAAALDGEVVVHDRFGTSTVAFCGFSYDIARARRERYPAPGALPVIAPATLAEDLRRRDFTVNAIAVALAGEEAGELTAVPGALDDLDTRLLRVLHERSFVDDPTRMLRLARYRGRLSFEVETRTRELVGRAIAGGALGTVSGPRVGAELRLAAGEADSLAVFESLAQLGLDHAIDRRFGIDGDEELVRRALALLSAGDGRCDRLVLAAAARTIPAGELRELLDRLGFEAEDRDVILLAATRAHELAAGLATATRPSEIAAAVAGGAPELVALAGALAGADRARLWLEQLRHVRLAIDGHDLLRAGIPEGPAIGRGLAAALAAKLDGRLRDRDEELAAAIEAARASG
jgi:tRNA nucleotidyltransferase (CCA-adding enzyme)